MFTALRRSEKAINVAGEQDARRHQRAVPDGRGDRQGDRSAPEPEVADAREGGDQHPEHREEPTHEDRQGPVLLVEQRHPPQLLRSQQPAAPPRGEDPTPVSAGRQEHREREHEVAYPGDEKDEAAVQQATISEDRTGDDEHVRWDRGKEVLDRCAGTYQHIQRLDGESRDQAQQSIEQVLHRGLPPGTNAGVERVDVTDLIEQGDRRHGQAFRSSDPSHALVGLPLDGYGARRNVENA